MADGSAPLPSVVARRGMPASMAPRPPRPAGVCFRPSARLTGAWIVLAVWALAAVILAVTTVYRRDV
jgi:hypothetical protein